MKKKLIIANWKLNGNIKMISDYIKNLKSYESIYLEKNIVVIAPPTIYLDRVSQKISNINVFLGSQNVDIHLKGAFTGETSILMLQDIGVKYVIIGHSERRLLHNENNDLIVKKFHLIKNLNLIPVLCIGETLAEKKSGQTENVIKKQLHCILKNLGESAFKNTVIAYEPIWAIGTGVPSEPKSIQSIHKFIKNYISQYNLIDSKNIIIQYGGSVNSLNIKEFIKNPDIDGFLIGNASLNAEEFFKIIKISSNIT